MGLVLKPYKCRSLTLKSGIPVNTLFYLKEDSDNPTQIESVLTKPMKFLGSEVTENNSPNAMFAMIFSKLEIKLENINKSTLRGEHKVNIYARYALPSMRYFMSVHHIHKTHEAQLDSLARFKLWLNIQKNGVTDASIFHPYMLAKNAPSQLYKEAHAGTYAMIRTKGDKLVNHALHSRVERESAWTKKSATAPEIDNIFRENIANNNITINTHSTVGERKKMIEKAKKHMNISIKEETLQNWNYKVNKLVIQGDFVKLLIELKSNITWKSICNNIPKGVLSFALKASVNGLNTPDNLKRWGARKLAKCTICGNFRNLEHILNWCTVGLNQGRFKWRHDSVLHYMASYKNNNKPDEVTI